MSFSRKKVKRKDYGGLCMSVCAHLCVYTRVLVFVLAHVCIYGQVHLCVYVCVCVYLNPSVLSLHCD